MKNERKKERNSLMSAFKQLEVCVLDNKNENSGHRNNQGCFQKHWKSEKNDQREKRKDARQDDVLRERANSMRVKQSDVVRNQR